MDISKTCQDLKFKIRIWKILYLGTEQVDGSQVRKENLPRIFQKIVSCPQRK